MLTATLSPPSASRLAPAVPTDYIFRLTVEQYHEMIRIGILNHDDRVELLEGWLIAKMPKAPSHVHANERLREGVRRVLPAGWHTRSQDPITLDTSEPEPDLTVARGELADYADHHPTAQEIAQLVEVADSTLARDRGMKKRVYARARIPVYWIVNLPDQQVEVYTEPSGPAEQPDYAQRRDFGLADAVPVVIDGKEIGKLPVAEFLG